MRDGLCMTNKIPGDCSRFGASKLQSFKQLAMEVEAPVPALIIFKERNGVLGPRVRAPLQYPDNVRVTASTNGWMTKEKLLRWIQDIWIVAEDGERRLLLLDHYKPHRAESLIESWTLTWSLFQPAAHPLPSLWMFRSALLSRRE